MNRQQSKNQTNTRRTTTQIQDDDLKWFRENVAVSKSMADWEMWANLRAILEKEGS